MRALLTRTVCIFLVASLGMVHGIAVNPGYNGDVPNGKETESPLRRGEVIFFISYPFTFLGSLLTYNLAAAAIRSADTGKSDFAPNGGFYALVAATAAVLSFGIALEDYYAVRAETRAYGGAPTGYLALDYRF